MSCLRLRTYGLHVWKYVLVELVYIVQEVFVTYAMSQDSTGSTSVIYHVRHGRIDTHV